MNNNTDAGFFENFVICVYLRRASVLENIGAADER
jgi:hypothetical protein